jgi:serine/threonine-protein kinase RsbW
MPVDGQDATIRLVVPSTPLAVRDALGQIFGGQALREMAAAERGTAEIVLAEVLNNVVEHAYASATGEIEVTIRLAADTLTVTVIDGGCGMPGDMLPGGRLAGLDTADLPEGGFGWHLIRTLASDLAYRRVGERNELSFRLTPGQWP